MDEFEFHDRNTTLWGWPNQTASRLSDPPGNFAPLRRQWILQRLDRYWNRASLVWHVAAVAVREAWQRQSHVPQVGEYIRIFPGGSWRMCQYQCTAGIRVIVMPDVAACPASVPQ